MFPHSSEDLYFPFPGEFNNTCYNCFRDLIVNQHNTYLTKHDGLRPKKWDSPHCAITKTILEPYEDN